MSGEVAEEERDAEDNGEDAEEAEVMYAAVRDKTSESNDDVDER